VKVGTGRTDPGRIGDDARARAAVDASLAEFNALRQEIQNRSGAQHLMLNVTITATATIVGVIAARRGPESFLLLLTFVCPTLGMLWADHARTIGSLGRHIDTVIRPRVEGIGGKDLLAWEKLNRNDPAQEQKAVNFVFRLAYFLIFVGPPLAAIFFTPFREPSVSGSVHLFWICWGAGLILTALTAWLIAQLQFSGIAGEHDAKRRDPTLRRRPVP
jgi:hypothetical protein